MSRLLVTQYQSEIDNLIRYGGSRNEASIRRAFENLLNQYCKPRNYMLVPELDFKTKFNTTVRPDGTVKDAIRLEHGWWESKDEFDVLDLEIEKKFEKGYPDENILFEDSQTAVLFQHGREQLRVSMRDADELDGLIATFVDYERPEVRDFRTAIKAFRDDIPHILEALRDEIKKAERENERFRDRRNSFLEVCRQSINPEIEIFDIHEMLIQHILTEDIFTNIFHESQFHRENNIAREISEIIATFFTGATRKNTLKSIEHYYAVIRRKSENIANHHEKQKFLKAVYENFYKAIKDSYIKEGTAQNQIVVYDMYTRFFRWATDRLGKNGIIAFITNRSFIDSKTFDGFRKCVERDFDHIYIVDTQSDVRNNPKISGTKNNVFGIQTGIAVMFLVKTAEESKK